MNISHDIICFKMHIIITKVFDYMSVLIETIFFSMDIPENVFLT